MGIEILVFEVESVRFGVRSMDVVQVLRAASLSPLPQAPETIEGVLNLRGDLLPVLNTRGLFGLPAKEMQHTDHLIVVTAGERVVALRADRATDLVRLEDERADSAVNDAHGHLIEFVAKTSTGLVHVLDPRRLLAGGEAASIVDALANRTASEAMR